MKCKNIHKDLIAYLDKDLPDWRYQEIAEHIQNCEKCRKSYESLKQKWELWDQKERIPYQPFYYTRLKQRMANQKQAEHKPLMKKALQPALFSVLIILGLALGVFLGMGVTNPPMQSQESGIENESIETYANSQYVNGMELETIEQYWLSDHSTSSN